MSFQLQIELATQRNVSFFSPAALNDYLSSSYEFFIQSHGILQGIHLYLYFAFVLKPKLESLPNMDLF